MGDFAREFALKKSVLAACNRYVEERLSTAGQAMKAAQEAANAEGKSSAGDKYETGRAMMHIQREQAAQQVTEATKLKRVLDQIDVTVRHVQISLGSVVITENLKIFVAIGAGKMGVDGDQFLVVGPLSPLGKVLVGLQVNDQFIFNSNTHTVLEIL